MRKTFYAIVSCWAVAVSAQMNTAPLFDGRASSVAVSATGRKLERATVRFLIAPDARQQEGLISIFSHDGWAPGAVHILLNGRNVNFCAFAREKQQNSHSIFG